MRPGQCMIIFDRGEGDDRLTGWSLPLAIWIPLFAVGNWLVFLGPDEEPHGERHLRKRLMARLPALGLWSTSGIWMTVGLIFFSADDGVAEFFWIGVGFAFAAIVLGLWYRKWPWWYDGSESPEL